MPNKEEIARGAVKGSKRGSVNNENRLLRFKKAGAEHGNADWGTVDPKGIAAVVTAMQAVGGAVTFGLSRDGGAYMLTLLLDGNRETLWFNGDADVEGELVRVIAELEDMR